MVRQSFSHGRTKTVVVETVKRHARGKVETKPPGARRGADARRRAARPRRRPPGTSRARSVAPRAWCCAP